MKRLSMLLNWQKLTIIGLAVLAGGTVTAYELTTASDRIDEGSSTSRPLETDEESAENSRVNADEKDQAESRTSDEGSKGATSATELIECHKALRQTRDKLRKVNDYSARFRLRERINGELSEEQQVVLRVRHQPFSVHMKWVDDGKEAVFVAGRNDDKLVVRPGGLASLVGTLELDPHGETAMEKSRYPITEAGMLALIEKLIAYQKPLIKNDNGVTCRKTKAPCEGEMCDCYTMTYADPSICDGYARTTLHISQDSGLLVSIENYAFDKSSSSKMRLIEHYVYTDIEPDVGLGDEDFTLAQSGLAGRLRTAIVQRNRSR